MIAPRLHPILVPLVVFKCLTRCRILGNIGEPPPPRLVIDPARYTGLLIGDLYLMGNPLLGAFSAHKSGHALNNRLLRELIRQPDAWEMVTFDRAEEAPAGVLGLARQPA